jgi:hypothetical protein
VAIAGHVRQHIQQRRRDSSLRSGDYLPRIAEWVSKPIWSHLYGVLRLGRSTAARLGILPDHRDGWDNAALLPVTPQRGSGLSRPRNRRQSFGCVLFVMSDDALRYLELGDCSKVSVGPSGVLVDRDVAKTLAATITRDTIQAVVFGKKG